MSYEHFIFRPFLFLMIYCYSEKLLIYLLMHSHIDDDFFFIDGKRETSHRNEYINAAITSDLGEVSLYLKDTEETDDVVYKNLPTEHSVYKIPIRNLKEVISEKLKNDGFKKEYEVRQAVLYFYVLYFFIPIYIGLSIKMSIEII